jgi:hypothetical protein
MKSLAIALVIALSTLAAGTVTASADTFTVHGVFGGNEYGGR